MTKLEKKLFKLGYTQSTYYNNKFEKKVDDNYKISMLVDLSRNTVYGINIRRKHNTANYNQALKVLTEDLRELNYAE